MLQISICHNRFPYNEALLYFYQMMNEADWLLKFWCIFEIIHSKSIGIWLAMCGIIIVIIMICVLVVKLHFLFSDLDGGLLSNQVRSLDLLVNVAWVGPHLNEFVVNRVANNHPVLFFNWIPNDLTAAGNFSRIHLPMCRASVDSPVDCDFEVNQLAKIVWSMMKSHAPEAYHVIQRVELHFFN